MARKVYIILAVVIVLIIFGRFELAREGETLLYPASPSMRVGGVFISLEVADTEEKREKGLSGRATIRGNHGMLFVFDESGRPQFWMKEMKFPIDIIWISEAGKIVDITHDARPESYPNTFSPRAPAKYVLEVSSGWAVKNNIDTNSLVSLENIR